MNRELKYLIIISGFFNLAGGMFFPIYAIFVEEIGGDVLTAGIAYSIFGIGAGILLYIIAKWEDRVKHQEKLLVVGYLMSTLGFLGYYFVAEPMHLFLVQILFAIGAAVHIPVYDGLYSKNLDKGKYDAEWGNWEAMYMVVTGIAAVIGGYFAITFGFRPLFLLMFAVSMIGVVFSVILAFSKKK